MHMWLRLKRENRNYNIKRVATKEQSKAILKKKQKCVETCEHGLKNQSKTSQFL
jgi:hypothetical protein